MTEARILAHIDKSQVFSYADLPLLKELTERHPACSIYALSYLQTVFLYDSLRFDEELSAHAFKVSDRAKLYELLYSKQEVSDTVTEKTEEISIEVPKQNLSKSASIQEEIATPELIETVENVAEESVLIHNTNAINETRERAEIEVIEAIEPNEIQNEIAVSAETRIIEEKVEEKEITKPIEPIASNEAFKTERSFTNWLNSGNLSNTEKTLIKPSSNNQSLEENKGNEAKQEIKLDSPTIEKIERNKPVVTEKRKLNADDLISRFIENNPSISRSTTPPSSKVAKDKKSLNEGALPVSETLAKLYEAQGNYPKAIHVYHQLIIHFPARKEDFMPRIAELKIKMGH